MRVRRATEADREMLYALWDEWVGEESTIPPWVEGAREGTRAEIDEAIRDGAAAVSEDGGEPLGFACGVLRSNRSAEVTELYVRPSARRRGVGRQLLRAVVAHLHERGACFVSVEVGVDNTTARSVYEQAGFRPEALRLISDIGTLQHWLGDSKGTRRAPGAD